MKRRPCFFANRTGPCAFRPDGQPDPAHLIPKQRLRQAGIENVWDERLIIPACRLHHHRFDYGLYEFTEDDYPASLIEWAEEHNWFFDSRTGWRAAAVAEHSA